MPADKLQPESPVSEELVAYLDGELSPEENRRVEERLAVDEDYRQQLRELDQTWEALEALPQRTVRDDFARTTIEMVAFAAQRDVRDQNATATASRRRRVLGAVVLGAAAAAIGFVALRALLPDQNRALVADLPVIMQVDLLAQQVDADFLRRLAQAVPPERLADDEQNLVRDLEEIRLASAHSPAERGPWIRQRSPRDKATLAARASRFQARDADEQERFRRVEQEIATAEDADQLRRTLLAYGQWLDRRTSGQRAELRDLPSDQRIARIQEHIVQDERRAERLLSADDTRRLRETIFDIAQQHKHDVLEEMQERPSRRARAAFLIVVKALRDETTRGETRQRLIGSLSPPAQEFLERARRMRRGWPDQQLIKWMYDSLKPERGPDVLEQFFASDQLDNDQRERLLNLPPGEMEAELERLYFAEELGLRGREWLGDFEEPSGFGRGLPGFGRPPWGGDDRRRDRPPAEGPRP